MVGESGEKIVDVRVFDAVSGGDALLVLDAGSMVLALVAFQRPGDGRAAARVLVWQGALFDPVAGGEALVVLEGHTYGSRFDSLHGPGDGRAAARERIRRQDCASLEPGGERRGDRGGARGAL